MGAFRAGREAGATLSSTPQSYPHKAAAAARLPRVRRVFVMAHDGSEEGIRTLTDMFLRHTPPAVGLLHYSEN